MVHITYYTDPLCCWSWAMNDHWIRLKDTYNGNIGYRYCMVGLIPDWNHFHDDVHLVSRPAQMGPVWMEAAHLTQTPIKSTIWIHDPPSSSYLACIAVKCAELQSPIAGERVLQLLWKEVMQKGINISTETVLLRIARELSVSNKGLLDMDVFAGDLTNGRGLEAFRKDLHEVQQLQITRYPCMLMRSEGQKPIMLAGYKPFSVLTSAVDKMIGV